MAGPQFSMSRPKTLPKERRTFSLKEANRTLPLISRIVRDIVNAHQRATQLQTRLEESPGVKEAMLMQDELESLMDRLQDYLEELQEVGAELKDYESGLIDFPGLHSGHEVCLCWKLGEAQIAYWHETDAGYAGRQPVEALKE